MIRSFICAALCLALTAPQSRAAESPPVPVPAPRYTLKQVRVDAAATPTSRYTANARFAPIDSAGELRESATFSLIGRFAKAGISCGSSDGTIFRNGFEGNP